MPEIQWIGNACQSGLNQVYSSGLEYCFVSENNQQLHPFVLCKDFLHDVVFSSLHQKTAKIYGFTFNPVDSPLLDFSSTRLAVVSKNEKALKDKVERTVEFINHFAKLLHIKKTYISEVTNPPEKYKGCGCFLTIGSKIWQNSPPLLSMYTLFLRSGMVHNKGDDPMKTWEKLCKEEISGYGTGDTNQMGKCKKGVEKLLKLGYRKFFYKDSIRNYPPTTDIATLHNSCGIVSFSSNSTANVVPYWHRNAVAV